MRLPGACVWAVAIGAAAYFVSCLLVQPLPQAEGFGLNWEAMSRDPFALVGQHPHRILTSLLSWLFGFRGPPDFMTFTRIMAVVFLATIAFVSLRRGAAVIDAALIALAMALTAPIQIYKQVWCGYCDALTYTLLLCMLLAVRRPAVFWSLFFLGMTNHELVGFLLPWAWFARRQQDDRRRADAIGAAVAVGLYVAFYFVVKKSAPAQLYSSDYFLGHPLFPGGAMAVWVTSFVHWVIAFGPVLAVIAWHQHEPANGVERRHLWWVLAGLGAILCIAFDYSRHCNVLVVPFVLAATRFLQRGPVHRAIFVGLVALGAGLMTVWSPWVKSSWPTAVFTDAMALAHDGVLIDYGGHDLGFGPLSATVQNWLPRVWPTLWPTLCILALIWTAGALLARWRPVERRLHQSAPLQ